MVLLYPSAPLSLQVCLPGFRVWVLRCQGQGIQGRGGEVFEARGFGGVRGFGLRISGLGFVG